ncbi:MAG: DUF3095 domain-containing protein [Oscillochloridaceae bacterium umkhey_bin13]
MSDDFYATLPPLSDFRDLADLSQFAPLPADWFLVVTDVVGSTQAIAGGRYKEVNMAGASAIAALLNLAGPLDIPFIFGGDGASLAIPPSLYAPARAALASLRTLTAERLELELRVGIVPVADLRAAGYSVLVARVAIAEHYAQALFSGGLAYAEALIKDPVLGQTYLINESADPEQADLSGLECRWQDIPSRHGETVSLLVTAHDQPEAGCATTIREVLEAISTSYGSDYDFHPIARSQLQATLAPGGLRAEMRLRGGAKLMTRLRYLAEIWGIILAVRLYRSYEALVGRVPWWDRYRNQSYATTDYKKYDDTLRMVLAGTAAQRAKLTAWLEQAHQDGRLSYGLHVADRATLTCLVFERMGRQVHFVDGADGGYALAARELKQQLAASHY